MEEITPLLNKNTFTLIRRIRSGGLGGVLSTLPVITELTVTGLDVNIVRVWSTLGSTVTVTGIPDTVSRRWLLEGAPMQGATTPTVVIDPSFDNKLISLQVDAENTAGLTTEVSPAYIVNYPMPTTIGVFPALSGAVGDSVDIPLASYFFDGNPSSAASISLAYTATGLPSGLSILNGRLVGTFAAPVTAQSFTISATNSGGTVAQTAAATVTGGAFLYNYDFNLPGDPPAEFTKSNVNLRLSVDPADPSTGVNGSVGALKIEGFALPGGSAAAGSSNVQRDYDVSSAPDGTTYDVTVCATVARNSATSTTGNIRLRWINAAGTVVLTEYTHSIATPTAGEKIICDGVYTMTKPAGLSATKLRVQLDVTNWAATAKAEIKKLRLDGGPVVIPTVSSAVLSGDGKVGSVHTATVITNPVGEAVSFIWYKSDVVIPGVTGSTYTPVVGDDLSNITFTATPTGGSAVVSNAVLVTRQPPVVTGVSLTPSAGVPGATLTYDLGTATNGATASFQLYRDEVLVASGTTSGTFVTTDVGAYRLVVVWENSGGQQVITYTSTIAAPAVGQPIILFSDAFATADKIAEFATPAAWTHNAALTNAADLIPGAIQFGTALPLATSETHIISKPFAAGRIMEAYIIASASAGTTLRVTLRLKNAVGGTTWSQAITSALNGFTVITPAAPAGTVAAEMIFELRGIAGNLDGVRKLTLHKLKMVDITDSGPTPIYNNATPQHNSPHAYLGEQTLGIDYAVAFTGTVTHYGYSGPEPHTWTGSILRITPDAEISPTASRFITAFNGPLESNAACRLYLRVYPTPAVLSLPLDQTPILDAIEVDRPMRVIHPQSAVSGGVEPYTYSVTNKPDWVIQEDHNDLFFGIAPATPQALVNMVVRVTDQRGDFVDVTYPIQVVATRSRTPFITIAPTLDLKTAIGANKGNGRVIQLQAGTYSMGKWYRFHIGDPANPMIIRGVGNATVMTGALATDECEGLIFENMACRFTTRPAIYNTTGVFSALGRYNRYYDLDVEGWTEPITDLTGWLRPELYAHEGVVKVFGTGMVVDNMSVRKVQSGFGCVGREIGIYRSNLRLIRDDMVNASQIKGLVIYRTNGYTFDGNHNSGEHRDFFQSMGDNSPGVHEVTLYECFFSGGQAVIAGIANEGVQGCYIENDGYNYNATRNPLQGNTIERANTRFRIRSSTFFAGSNYGMYFFGHVDCKADRCVAIGHPEQMSGKISALQNAGMSEVLATGLIHEGVGFVYAPTVVIGRNQAVLSGSVNVSGTGATAPATIFPNWNNTGLAYEDPREAVANSQPASAARFWIDPAGAWSLANPAVGPTWLRTGTV